MDLHPSRTYTGPLKAVILDWAGTTLDHGCMAPAVVFIEVYRRKGVEVTMAEARVPMGAHKRVHIQQLGQLPSVQEKWLAAVGRPITEADIDEMFAEFIPLQLACLADYADLIPGTLETIANIRSRGLKIGSTTGYTGEMMGLLLEEARKRGYEPDSSVCATDVPVGRPEPWMCVMNALKLGVFPFEAIVKVDDTLPGIDEGLNAGMWTIGLAMSGNECGLTLEQLEALEPQKRDLMRARAYQRMTAAGAHYVIDSIAELPAVLDAIEIRLAKGERPTDNGSQFWSLQDNTLVNTAAEPRFH